MWNAEYHDCLDQFGLRYFAEALDLSLSLFTSMNSMCYFPEGLFLGAQVNIHVNHP